MQPTPPTGPIILFGYRGSGKSTVGRLLADTLGRPFFDTDALVREQFGGAAIADIWREYGEPAFREMESQVTADLCASGPQAKPAAVIALGGGTIMQPDAHQAVAQATDALRVYLQAQPQTLQQRIAGDAVSAANRPSLIDQSGGAAELDEITHVLNQRDPVYRAAADRVLAVDQLSAAEVVQAILQSRIKQ